MFLSMLIALALWVVGMLLYSIGIMQILISLFCTIPATRRFAKERKADTTRIYKRSIGTIILWSAITAAIVWAVLTFANIYGKVGFAVGIALPFLLSLGKLGMNNSNLQDYWNAYGSCYETMPAVQLLLQYAQDSKMEPDEYWEYCFRLLQEQKGKEKEEIDRLVQINRKRPMDIAAFELISEYAKNLNMTMPQYLEHCAAQPKT